MIGPRMYIFGGHAQAEFFSDIWCFDLSTRAYHFPVAYLRWR